MWIILNRMIKYVNTKLRPEQASFRNGRSCIDHIDTLRIIIEQSVEMRFPLYHMFVDYEKAFDLTNKECIWTKLGNIGVPIKIISLIQSSYEAFPCKVFHDGNLSEPFLTRTGVRCLLSPLLFLALIDVDVSTYQTRRYCVGPSANKPALRVPGMRMTNVSPAARHALKLDDLANVSAKVGLLIHAGKTKEMRINTNFNVTLTLNDRPIKRVTQLSYLESIMTNDGGAQNDVESRIRKKQGVFIQLIKV